MKTALMLLKNIFGHALTVRFPQAPPIRPGYRGLVEYEAAKCTGCSLCAFRCSSHAIVFRGTKTDIKWSYDPAQCTFCARCVDGCEAGALSMSAECPPVYFTAGDLKRAYVTPRIPPAPKPAATGDAQ
jgi:formate hydrogenlyase subunit 6/NADH:ubiquinone oxidoreductase subunit I